MSEIPLKEWARAKKVPYRTAIEWANRKKIPAVRKKKTVIVVQEKELLGYYISPEATKPR